MMSRFYYTRGIVKNNQKKQLMQKVEIKKTFAHIAHTWDNSVWAHESLLLVCSHTCPRDYLYAVNNRTTGNSTSYSLTIPKAFANAKAGKMENATYIVTAYKSAIVALRAYKKAVDSYKGKKVCIAKDYNWWPVAWADDNTLIYSPILETEAYQRSMLDMHRIVRDYVKIAEKHEINK